MPKPQINIVGKGIDRWIFRRMAEEIAAAESLDVAISEEPQAAADLHHFFRPQDAEAALKAGWKRKFLTTLHGFLPGATDYELNERAYAHAAAVVAVSRDCALYLTSSGVEPHRIRLIHAGADPETFRMTGWPRGHFTVGVASKYYPIHGSVEDNKGGLTIMRAMKLLASRAKETMLLIVGSGWGWLAEALAHLPFPVLYYEVGRNCTYADYPRILNQIDCLLVASKFEGGPVAAYEAMMCGRPLVSTAVGVVPELVVEGETGFIFPQGDAEACAEILLKLRQERSDWAGGRWRKPAEKAAPFTWARWRQLHERLYLDVLEA